MSTNIVVLRQGMNPEEIKERIQSDSRLSQGLYPVVDDDEQLVGVVTATQLQLLSTNSSDDGEATTRLETIEEPATAYPDEPLRVVVHRMAEMGLTRFPVISREDRPRLVGMVSLSAVLSARGRNLEAERRRERVISLRLPSPFMSAAQGSERRTSRK